MADFWENYRDITDQVMILCVISVIQYYADTHYHKTPCRISNLSGELICTEVVLYELVETCEGADTKSQYKI